MRINQKKKWISWLLIACASLGIHYLMLILAQILCDGGFSLAGLTGMIQRRLMEPGDATR